jgi:hypothetical protein
MSVSSPQSGVNVYYEQLQRWLKEAGELRVFDVPDTNAAPSEVHEAIQVLRGNLDRLEGILADVTALKIANRAAQRAREEEAQDAWDKQADIESRAAVRREFEGAEERYARWRLSTLPQLQAVRQARVLAEFSAQTEARVAIMFRGLRDVREELLVRLKYLQWESAMERT